MKHKFKAGDRVRAYGQTRTGMRKGRFESRGDASHVDLGVTGKVGAYFTSCLVSFIPDTPSEFQSLDHNGAVGFHARQLVKLKKKEPKLEVNLNSVNPMDLVCLNCDRRYGDHWGMNGECGSSSRGKNFQPNGKLRSQK